MPADPREAVDLEQWRKAGYNVIWRQVINTNDFAKIKSHLIGYIYVILMVYSKNHQDSMI